MNVFWYALRTKPNKEAFLAQQLEALDIEVYYPCLHVRPVNPRSRKKRPYFPGYLFVRVDLKDGKASGLKWMPGVADLVSVDGQPASIPDHLVIAIRRQVDYLNNSAQQGLKELQHGDRVKILSGPFAGYEGIFDAHLDGRDRVRVLLNFLQSRRVPIDLGNEKIEPLKRD